MRALLTGVVAGTLWAGAVWAAPEVLPPTAPTMKALQQIEAAGYRGKVDELRIKYQDQARQQPGDAMPRVYVAWCTLPSDDAWNQLKAIATIFPDNPWVHYGMGRIYSGWKGMGDLARTEFEGVLKRDPNFFPALVGMGDLARLKDNHEQAVAKYRAALAIADDPFARAGLGLSLAALDKPKDARAELQKAIALQPEQPAALEMLVKLALGAKDPAALTAAQALAELRPKDRAARKMLAELRFEAGDKAAAAKEYDRLVRLGNAELPVLQRLAELFRDLGDVEGEERVLQSVAALDDKNPQANLRMAELRLAQKDKEGAEANWREALARDPKQVDALLAIARLRLDAGQLHEAAEELRAAVAVDPSRAEAVAELEKLTESFKLPARKPKGNVNNVYWAVQASLGKFFTERKAANPELAGKLRFRVRITKEGKVDGVDVLEDTLKDPLLLAHVYFGLRDAEYARQKGEPVFDFELGAKKGK